jgi:hypothetical protein
MLSEADKTLENLESAAAIETHRREEDKSGQMPPKRTPNASRPRSRI